jgi:hypothetical protein
MKTRNIPIHTGSVPDLLWSPQYEIGGYPPECYNNRWKTDEEYMAAYTNASLARYMSVPCDHSYWDGVGTEAFESSKRRRPHYNDCYHTRCRGLNLPFLAATCVGSAGYTSMFRRIGFPSKLDMTDTPELSLEYSSAQRRAWWHMQPRFEGRISMLNFLFELKDFRDIAKYVLKADKIKHFRSLGRWFRKNMNRPEFFDPTRSAASIWLSWHLNWEQFFKDCSSIFAQAATLAREAEASYKTRGLGQQKSHYSEIIYDDSDFAPVSRYGPIFTEYGSRRLVKFTASMQYKYAYTMRTTMDAFIHYWGLTLTAEAFWNAIPFSWVADYVIRIGDSLHAMNTDPHTDLCLCEYCESVLDMHTQGYHITPTTPYNKYLIIDGSLWAAKDTRLLSGLERTRYVREVRPPNYGPALPKLHFPTKVNALTFAALVRCLF